MFKVGLFYTVFPVYTSPVKSNRRVTLRSELLFPSYFFFFFFFLSLPFSFFSFGNILFRGVVNVFSIYSYISRSLLHFFISINTQRLWNRDE